MRILVLIVLLFSFVPPAVAAEAASLTLDDLLQRLKQHPEIQAYAARAESSRHYAQGELGLPDPLLFAEQRDYRLRSEMGRGGGDQMLGFKQEIPRPAIRQAKSDKMQVEAHKTGLMADYAFAAMKAQLITILANRQSFKEQERLLDEQESLLRSERGAIKGRISANQSGTSELSMSEADSAEVQIMRAELMEQEHESDAMLTNMLGEAPEVVLPAVKMEAWDHDLQKTYPVKISAEDVALAQKEVSERTAEFGPNFEVQGSYGRLDNGDNAGTIMVGISVPLWSSTNQKPRLEGATAALHSSRLDLDSAKRQVAEKLDLLKVQIDTSNKKMELLKTKDTHLGTSAKALTREYEAGKANLAMYLKARREAFSARISLAQERAKRIALIADFNRYIISGETK